jgi:hypothetical protein
MNIPEAAAVPKTGFWIALIEKAAKRQLKSVRVILAGKLITP